MHVREIKPEEIEQARLLLVANDWGQRVEDPQLFCQLIACSNIALVVIEDNVVIGFLRAVSDGIFNGYISMVVVDSKHRGRGVGTALVKKAIGENDRITWVLRAGRTGVSAFYEKLGFSVSEVAMERRGKRR
jgi:ribosomal protein S18 acetylase RimI-like enzyme